MWFPVFFSTLFVCVCVFEVFWYVSDDSSLPKREKKHCLILRKSKNHQADVNHEIL